MNLDTELMDILVCPVCRSTLAVDEAASALVCNACPRTYDVREGVPAMMVESDKTGAPVKESDVRRHPTR